MLTLIKRLFGTGGADIPAAVNHAGPHILGTLRRSRRDVWVDQGPQSPGFVVVDLKAPDAKWPTADERRDAGPDHIER